MLRTTRFVFLAGLLLATGLASAGGLIGDFFKAAGQATGITPLSDLGQNMDAEHKRFKDNNPFYRQLEENTSAAVREAPHFLACTWTFETVIGSVRTTCSGFNAQGSYPANLIPDARQRLIEAGVLPAQAFDGVSINWCPGSFRGRGIAPADGEIILNTAIASDPLDDVAATLAHEMFHIRQYREIGSANFKCNYAQQYIACGGCQDERLPIERDAYQFEAFAYRQLAASGSATASAPTERMQSLAEAASEHSFLTQPLVQPWQPPRPALLSDGLAFGPGSADPAHVAEKACTLGGRLDYDEAENCTEDLTIIYEDFLETVEEDFSQGNRYSVDHYLKLTGADRSGACAILRVTHADPEISRRRPKTCETISRSAIYKVLSYALDKYAG